MEKTLIECSLRSELWVYFGKLRELRALDFELWFLGGE